MFELTINGNVYQFKFGMGFLRELNEKVKQPVDGLKEQAKGVGLRYYAADLYDEDPESLVTVLLAANKGMSPRITQPILDDFIDNEETDLAKVFEEVLDFLRSANACKKVMKDLDEAVAKEKERRAKAEANQ